jgi:Kdo2-lipid IVA lauroyltransferase/acyltransferase
MYKFLLHPKNWLIGFTYLLARLLLLLPYTWLMCLGRVIGYMAYCFARKRRIIAKTNIAACFPDLSKKAQRQLVVQNFMAICMSMFETAIAYFSADNKFINRYEIQGIEHLEAALRDGKGVLLLSAHFMTLDLAVRMLSTSMRHPIHMMYRKHNNAFIEYLINKGRKKYCIPLMKKEVGGVYNALAQDGIVWYAPDQNFSYHHVFVPFFGVQAATVTGTSRLAGESGAKVIPFFFYRNDDNYSYVLEFNSPLEDFPTEDKKRDAARINQIIEAAVRKHPEQYLWTHRRFKTRPPGERSFYPRSVIKRKHEMVG